MEVDSKIGKWYYIINESSHILFFRCDAVQTVGKYAPILSSKYWITNDGNVRVSVIPVYMAEESNNQLMECSFTDILEYFLEGTTPSLLN